MKNYTITERQKIYEHLLTLDCPDLLAALIAQRADKTFMDCEVIEYTSLLELITNTFLWEEAEEGWEFWFEIQECLYADEYETPSIADVIESTEQEMFNKCVPYSLGDKIDFGGVPCVITGVSPLDTDFESPTEADFATDKKSSVKIHTTYPVKGVGFTQEKVSFWTKVKLFFGRLSYRV